MNLDNAGIQMPVYDCPRPNVSRSLQMQYRVELTINIAKIKHRGRNENVKGVRRLRKLYCIKEA